ncbi:MAG: hypothetical protein AB7G37_11025 [Solirubrobacteraceae bacterium]
MRRQPLAEADLERHLLRLSLGSLHAERLCCDRCRRTPLVGEVVYRYPRNRTLCALCRPTRKDEPVASVPVRHGEEIRAQRISRTASDDTLD